VFDMINAVEKGEGWNAFFVEVVDETLKQILKEDGAKVIYEFLENHSCLKLEEISDKPEVFSASLEMLMASAARVIEQMILKKLYSELGLKFEEKKGCGFPDYIKELRKSAVDKE